MKILHLDHVILQKPSSTVGDECGPTESLSDDDDMFSHMSSLTIFLGHGVLEEKINTWLALIIALISSVETQLHKGQRLCEPHSLVTKDKVENANHVLTFSFFHHCGIILSFINFQNIIQQHFQLICQITNEVTFCTLFFFFFLDFIRGLK